MVQLVAGKGPMWDGGVVYWDSIEPPDLDRLRVHHVLTMTLDSAQRAHEVRKNPKIVFDEFSQINVLDFFCGS